MKLNKSLRNIAIIAHVDHGKTTLVDKLLQQSGTFNDRTPITERIMDSNELEKERGITILAKNTSIEWRNFHINIVDTPGHADFGGEVERILSMVDSVLLLVDAVDGPMPQTRFVTQKAFAAKLNPIVVINKIDRPGARPSWVIDQVFDLFDHLGGTEEQLDFPIVYCSALNGYASLSETVTSGDMTSLFETITSKVPPPQVDPDGPLQMQISSLDYSSYVGAIAIGRLSRGTLYPNQSIQVINRDGNTRKAKIGQVFTYQGLEKIAVEQASAGDIIALTGISDVKISDTLCDPDHLESLPPLNVDEPTITMTFQVNNSPFAGKEGKYLTSRQILERLDRELIHNVALRVEPTDDPDQFKVSGRGELHLSVLIETMRREGYELGVSRPKVITKLINGEMHEPYESLTLDLEAQHQGAIMEKLGLRKAELTDMTPDGLGRVRLDFSIPARGLIGFHTEFLTSTSGSGLIYHTFSHFGPVIAGTIGQRTNGVLVSGNKGKALAYAIYNLQSRGRMLIQHGTEVYEGMIVGIHSRNNDLVVNPLKAKQLTNIRAAGSDEALTLTPAIQFTLEQALEFIDDDELVEVTPKSIRIRKKLLTENERKRATRAKKTN